MQRSPQPHDAEAAFSSSIRAFTGAEGWREMGKQTHLRVEADLNHRRGYREPATTFPGGTTVLPVRSRILKLT